MRKNNRWTLGARNFVLPDLPEDQKGRHGCRFLSTTFDPAVGEEVFVLFMEEPDFVDQYSPDRPIQPARPIRLGTHAARCRCLHRLADRRRITQRNHGRTFSQPAKN